MTVFEQMEITLQLALVPYDVIKRQDGTMAILTEMSAVFNFDEHGRLLSVGVV